MMIRLPFSRPDMAGCDGPDGTYLGIEVSVALSGLGRLHSFCKIGYLHCSKPIIISILFDLLPLCTEQGRILILFDE